MNGGPQTRTAYFAFLLGILLSSAACATGQNGDVPVSISSQELKLPAATRILGQAAIYISTTGEKLEVVHDAAAAVAIVKLPDGSVAILQEEIAGSAGRYRNNSMTVWEKDGGVLLWIDGKLAFSGHSERD